jgi:hypothetical protein
MAFFTRLLGSTALAALAFPVACGSAPIRRPNVPVGSKVQELRHAAGDGAQDCGEVVEPKGGDTTCSVHPIGECVAAALKDCRAAYGSRVFFNSESDGIRIDWVVLSDGHGSCFVAVVDDKTADPLAPKTPILRHCKAMGWQPHDSVPSCETPMPNKCDDAKPT